MMKKAWNIKLNILLMTAFIVLLSLNVKSSEASEISKDTGKYYSADRKISMNVDYGYDHYAKYGRYMNVSVDLINNGEDFAGWLHIIIPKAENNVTYRKEIEVDSKSKEKFVIPIPVMDDTGILQVNLLDKTQKTIVESYNKINIENSNNQAYIGVLSDDKDKLSYLSNYTTKVFYLNENNLSDDFLGLDLLDIIIINHFDTDKLSSSQRKAIENWVDKGGTLVIGTGEYAKETLNKFKNIYNISILESIPPKLINYRMDEDVIQELKQHINTYAEERKIMLETIKNRNKMLKSYGKNPITIDHISPDQWAQDSINKLKIVTINKKTISVQMKNSITELLYKGNLLIQKRVEGQGTIQLFSFDLGLTDKENPLGDAILMVILDNMSSFKQQQLREEYFGAYSSHEIYDGITYTNTKNIPGITGFLIVLVLYILLIGPVTFLILKKYDKKSLSWFIVPVITVIFTFIMYLLGTNTRIKEPYAGYVDIINLKESNMAEEELYFALTAPFNYKYTVPFDKSYRVSELGKSSYNYYMNNSIPGKEVDLNKYVTSINFGVDKSFIEINNNPAFSPVYYQSKSNLSLNNQIICDLHYLGGKIYGNITNRYPFKISNAYIISDGYLISIGDISPGQTIDLINKKNIFLTSRDIFYNNDLINVISNNNSNKEKDVKEIDNKSKVLYYLAEHKLLNNFNSNYFIGFADDQDNTEMKTMFQNTFIEKLSKNIDCYGMKVLMLPVKTNYTNNDKIFVPSIDPYMDVNENIYDIYYSYRYMTSDSKITVYHFPKSDHIVSFDYLTSRNQKFDSEYQKNFEGKIYFLNNKTGNYDEVFKTGVGSREENLTDYLTDQNTITIRYNSDVSLQAYQMLLPYISYWKEANGK